MIDMTADAVSRLEHEARALELMAQADGLLQEAANEAKSADHANQRTAHLVSAVGVLLDLAAKTVRERAHEHTHMIGWQVATYEIAALAKDPANTGPIVWLTGNAMMPPLRELDACERVWHLPGEDGTFWEVLMDAIESKLAELNVAMEAPEYDNALYVVDLERWEYVPEEERDEDANTLNEEWRKRS